MPNRIDKTPITAYDIIGYLVPGITLFGLSLYSWNGLKAFDKIDVGVSNLGDASIIIISIILSYIAGHCIAVVSALSLERIVILYFKFPSYYLLNEDKKCDVVNRVRAENKLKLSLLILLNPLQFLSYFILVCLDFHSHFVKTMSKSHIEILKYVVARKYGINISNDNGLSWFGFVEKNVILDSQIGASRMYNYMNLYGFCRNMSVCFSLLLYFSICSAIYSTSSPKHISVFIALLAAGSIILSLGFLKFFRRYSQEAIMVFISKEYSLENKA